MLRICARNIHNITARRTGPLSSVVSRGFCEKVEKNETVVGENLEHHDENKLGGFAKAFEKHTSALTEDVVQEEKLPDLPFATLLRNSKFINVRYFNFYYM